MEMIIDQHTIKDIERTITEDKFAAYLMSNTTDFVAAAWILETLLKGLDDLKEKVNNDVHGE
jgi:hypothetical protein